MLAACLAVLGTTPARTFLRAVVEVVVAEIVAIAGALGVAGFRVDIDPARFAYTVLGLSMVAAVALVYRLGGGLHGLGRSGVLLFGAALVLLVVGPRLHRGADPLGVAGAAARRGVGTAAGCTTTWAPYRVRSRCSSASPPSPGA